MSTPTLAALVAYENGDVQVVQTEATLEALQGYVGGYVETIPVAGFDDLVAYGNEEGKIHHLRENPKAELLVGDVGLAIDDRLVGTWVILGYDDEGDNRGLTVAEIDVLTARLS